MNYESARAVLEANGFLVKTKRARSSEYHVIPGGKVSRRTAFRLIENMRLHPSEDGLPLMPFENQSWRWRGYRPVPGERVRRRMERSGVPVGFR